MQKSTHYTPDWIFNTSHSNYINVDIVSYNLYKISCFRSSIILDSSNLSDENTRVEFYSSNATIKVEKDT